MIKQQTFQLIDDLKATCQTYGMGNDGNEYKIITQVFLYKFLNDKFGYELKNANSPYAAKIRNAEKWENAYAELSPNERQMLLLAVSPDVPAKKKESMAIYTCFIQHVINSLKRKGKGAIVIPTGFVTAKSGVEKKILQKIVDDKIVYGCVSMPSNVFANTGTNVSVLFFDNSHENDKVLLIDASKMGEDYQENGLKKHRITPEEIDTIVSTFRNKEEKDEFSVAVTYDAIKEKGYSLSAGQYFDVKIEYVDITEEEFNANLAAHKASLKAKFEESRKLEEEIMKQMDLLKFEK